MPWTDQPGPRPHRSPDELLAAVERRATVIRRNRRIRLSAGLGGVAVVLLAATALARTGDDGDSELRVVGPVTTTSIITSTTAPELLATTSTLSPPPPSSIKLPPSTRPPTTRTTLARSPATTASPPTTSPRATTTTEPPPLRACDPSDVVVTATPDRASYPRGAVVTVVLAATNRSTRACQPVDPGIEFRDGAGNLIGGVGVADVFTMGVPGEPRPSWDPGETLSVPMDLPMHCANQAPCPPGPYTATAVFGPFRSAPAAFTLT